MRVKCIFRQNFCIDSLPNSGWSKRDVDSIRGLHVPFLRERDKRGECNNIIVLSILLIFFYLLPRWFFRETITMGTPRATIPWTISSKEIPMASLGISRCIISVCS